MATNQPAAWWPVQPIAAAIPDGVALVDPQDRVIAWNAQMADLVGIPSTVALGDEFAALDVSSRVPQLRAALEDVKRDGHTVVLPFLSIPARDGAIVTVTATVGPVRDGSRRAVLIHLRANPGDPELGLEIENQRLLTGTEELMAINDELREARDELEIQLARMVITNEDTALVGRAVSALIALVASRRIDAGAADRAFALVAGTPKLDPRVLDELADLDALNAGKLRLDRADFALDGVAVDAVDAATEAASTAGIRVDLTAAERVLVRADRGRLRQIASTLIGNAIRCTPEGGRVDVNVSLQGAVARLTVVDSGRGLSAAGLSRIFEPFSRERAHTPGDRHGLGLRLAVARRVVELHGGAMRAESEGDSRGTTMTVLLPAL